MSAVQLLINELGLRKDLRLPITARIPAEGVAELDRIAASAGVSRSRMAAALLQDGMRRYSHAG